ncbi:MAG: NTP transferase domain-containing protein [Bdellovibrionota bacterium]
MPASNNTHLTSPNIAAIVLAAGKGTRMKSQIPKVLHKVAGRPMIESVLSALKSAGVGSVCIVLGGDLKHFEEFINTNPELSICQQHERRGTGDAVASAARCFTQVIKPRYANSTLLRGGNLKEPYVLICAGDTPAIKGKHIADFITYSTEHQADISVLGMNVPYPAGYGRLVLKNDKTTLVKIVEEKDASSSEREITVCNSGIILAKTDVLFKCLDELTPLNAQNEYYLTDIIEVSKKHHFSTIAFVTNEWNYFAGVNSPEQKHEVEKFMLAETNQ